MPYTALQKLRRMQAKNRGLNHRLAVALRYLATMLEKKGTGEFTRGEIRLLTAMRKQLEIRLQVNAIAASAPLIGKYRRVKVKYDI